MVKTSKKTLPGTYFLLDGGIEGTVVELFDGTVLLKLQSIEGVKTAIEKYGTLPLPPYIKRPTTDEDKDRYQTVFARRDGAVAAPTAMHEAHVPSAESTIQQSVMIELSRAPVVIALPWAPSLSK